MTQTTQMTCRCGRSLEKARSEGISGKLDPAGRGSVVELRVCHCGSLTAVDVTSQWGGEPNIRECADVYGDDDEGPERPHWLPLPASDLGVA